MKKIFLLGTSILVLAAGTYAQTGKDGKGKAKDSVRTTTPVKSCPGKTCGKKKS
jgi:hypothetical protein